MHVTDLAVLGVSAAFLAAFYGWFFFSKRAGSATAAIAQPGGLQQVEIIVKGGYSPDVISVRRGVPLRLAFRREESGACTDRVVIPDFGINQSLPAFTVTAVEFTPDRTGDFEFVCGMGMVHGQIQVR